MAQDNRKRSIFAEVGSEAKGTRAVPGSIDRGQNPAAYGLVRLWLLVLGGLVVAMILVGGLTRLTDSGLSITEWAPVSGALPPLSEAQWQSEFDRYRAIPEYQLQNKGMSLAEFKKIYWWEWGHRQLGRVIGLIWFAGFCGLLMARRFPVDWWPKGLWLGALGGLQGAIGWWMVSSGLGGTMLDVASYRLAVHLGLAFVILGFITWYVLELSQSQRALLQARRHRNKALFQFASVFMLLLFGQLLLGALVAGIDAGESYGTWPLMGGSFLPADMFVLEPIWRNFLENQGTVQFVHRTGAYLLLAVGVWLMMRAMKAPQKQVRLAFQRMAVILLGMIGIGILTVLTLAAPWAALTHQCIAIVLWISVLHARFQAAYPLDDKLTSG